MDNPWLFDQIVNTPSLRDGIPYIEEQKLRIEGVKFIQELGIHRMSLQYDTIATAAVFFQRFYIFHSFKMFPVYPMSATCLFLAGKVEETPKKSNDIVKFSKLILSETKFKQFGPEPKEEVLTLERILLQTLRFELEIEHPYEHLLKYVKKFSVSQEGRKDDEVPKELLQSAWTFVNDSFCSTLCVQYEPEIVAVAMINLACKIHKFQIYDWQDRKSDHKNWWDVYVENLDDIILEDCCHKVLDVYQYQQTEEPVAAT